MRGGGDVKYEPDPEWLHPPAFWSLGACPDVAVDDQDRIWIVSRGEHPVSVWTPDGILGGSWGRGDHSFPHGITIGSDARVWITDAQLHVVRAFDMSGQVSLELGQKNSAQATVTHDGRLGAPFNMPTASVCDLQGRIYVADGYGNRRVHRFSPEGALEISWGRSGEGSGEFALVHGVTVEPKSGRVVVSDRENGRLQFFTPDGDYIEEWAGLNYPAAVTCAQGLVYVVEMGPGRNEQPNGVSIFEVDGTLLGRWYAESAGSPVGPHGIAVDSSGNIYVADLAGEKIIKMNRL